MDLTDWVLLLFVIGLFGYGLEQLIEHWGD